MKKELNNSDFTYQFVKSFQEFLIRKCNYLYNNSILATVSGGIDSVVMVDLLSKADIPFEIAHVNFKLRGKESDIDEIFVVNLAKKYNVKINTISFDTQNYASESRISIEMAARKLRYEYFNYLIIERKLNLIATAHHLDDHLETLILNLSRGTTYKGFHGIKPQVKNLIRPLLFTSRVEIEKYAGIKKLEYRVDKSNDDVQFKRNLIRKNITPYLKQLNPSILSTTFRSSEFMNDYDKIVSDFILNKLKYIIEFTDGVLALNIQKIKESGFAKIIIYEALKEYGFSMENAEKVSELIENETGKSFFLEDYQVYKDRNKLILQKKSVTNSNEISIYSDKISFGFNNNEFQIDVILPTEIENIKNRDFAFLDYDKVVFPILVRTWKDSDIFSPFGMKGKKKLSDYFIDNKISLHKKINIPIFESDGKIFWLAGFRISDEFKITEQTRKVLRVRMIKESI